MSKYHVGQPVRLRGVNAKGVVHDGNITKVGSKLVTIDCPYSGYSGVYRIDTRHKNDAYGHEWFRTLEEDAQDTMVTEARATLREFGIVIESWSKLTPEMIIDLGGYADESYPFESRRTDR